MNRQQRKLMILGAIFVIMLAVAWSAYGLLRKTYEKQERTSQEQTQQQADTDADTASGSDTGSGSDSDTGSAGGSDSVDQKYYLKDFDPTVYTEDKTARTFTEIADGKPILINFWATWCPYCLAEFSDFKAIVEDYSDRVNFAFVDAVDGERETVEMGSRWLEENDFEVLPAYYDTELDAIYTYGVRTFPTTIICAADGEIVYASPGMINAENIRSILDSLV